MQEDTIFCHCHDGCIPPVIAVKNNNNKWELYGISKVYGMGNAEWEKKLYNDEFDEVIPLNSFSGLSYIIICKNNKYGLIQIKDNKEIECEITMLEGMTYDNKDELLQDKNIRIEDYIKTYPYLFYRRY